MNLIPIDRTEAINELIERWIEKNKIKKSVPATETIADTTEDETVVST